MQQQRDSEDDRKLLDNEERLRNLRKRDVYLPRLFWLGLVWLALLLAIILLQGFGFGSFELATGVLVTLIGSTTATVLGLFAIAARYLFPPK